MAEKPKPQPAPPEPREQRDRERVQKEDSGRFRNEPTIKPRDSLPAEPPQQNKK